MKKRILIISSKIPSDNDDGGAISQYVFTDYIREYYDVHCVFINNTYINKAKVEYLKEKWNNVSFSFFQKEDEVLKTNNFLYKIILKISKFVVNLFNKLNRRLEPKILDPYGQSRFFYPNYNKFINEKDFNKIRLEIIKFKPDLVQIENPPLMNLANVIPDSIPKIYIHHELQFARFESSITDKSDYYEYVFEKIKSLEIKYLNDFDYVFTFSEIDKDKLEECIDRNVKVFNSPFPVLDSAFSEINRESFKIEKLVFVGSQNHEPNIDAILWYINEMGPIIKKEIDLDLYITGNWTVEFKNQFKNHDFVHFTGFLSNLKEFCENSILIAPIRIGSGIRTKILYAMAQGIPVVSAKIGREGILSDSIIEANTVDDFIEKIKFIATNLDFSFKICKEGQEYILNNYSQEKLCNQRIRYYENICSNSSL